MPITLSFDELIAYSNEDRAKWDTWFRAQPESIWQIAVQPEGRFANVWSLIDHIFVVEKRHLQRLQGEYPLPESTGVIESRWPELWDWSLKTRHEVVSWAAVLDEEDARIPRSVQLPAGCVEVSPRKLRHWAQLALVFRQAGLVLPGDHDLIFSGAMR